MPPGISAVVLGAVIVAAAGISLVPGAIDVPSGWSALVLGAIVVAAGGSIPLVAPDAVAAAGGVAR